MVSGCSVELLRVVGDRCWPPGAVTPLPPAPHIFTGPEVHAQAFLGTNCASLTMKIVKAQGTGTALSAVHILSQV